MFLSESKMISHSMAKAYSRVAIALVLTGLFASCSGPSRRSDPIVRAFEQRQKGVQVEGEGTVARLLTDDSLGLPHQRFIVALASGHTIMIKHNTQVGSRIEGLKPGDAISFSGEYMWNDLGGMVHWTHHDPEGKHQAGWIKHNGRTYQ